MSQSSDKKAQTRRRVLNEAAAAIRAVGPEGIGVATLMAKAGLTHGGFYAHFKSKDDLVAQAISQMFEDSYELFLRRTANMEPRQALSNYINLYVSPRHRDDPERGCPLPSLSGDLARMPSGARERFAAGLERLTGAIAELLGKLGHSSPDRLADSVVSEMVGAVALSRAISDGAASNRILERSREAIKSRLGLTNLKNQ
jgi:TetR/AcrR family transcriptional regulator, transcriptional repressor for nem operon